MDLGNVTIKLINTSNKTLEAMLKILEDLQEFQDSMTIKHGRKDARKRRTVAMDNHKKSWVMMEAGHRSLGST